MQFYCLQYLFLSWCTSSTDKHTKEHLFTVILWGLMKEGLKARLHFRHAFKAENLKLWHKSVLLIIPISQTHCRPQIQSTSIATLFYLQWQVTHPGLCSFNSLFICHIRLAINRKTKAWRTLPCALNLMCWLWVEMPVPLITEEQPEVWHNGNYAVKSQERARRTAHFCVFDVTRLSCTELTNAYTSTCLCLPLFVKSHC